MQLLVATVSLLLIVALMLLVAMRWALPVEAPCTHLPHHLVLLEHLVLLVQQLVLALDFLHLPLLHLPHALRRGLMA